MRTPKHLFRQTVTLYPSTAQSIDEYGRETWSTGTDHDARVELKNKVMRDEKGEEQQIDGMAYFKPNVSDLEVGSRLDFNSKNYRIFRINEIPDDLGSTVMTEAVIQKWNF